jgi:hypothetical protein
MQQTFTIVYQAEEKKEEWQNEDANTDDEMQGDHAHLERFNE